MRTRNRAGVLARVVLAVGFAQVVADVPLQVIPIYVRAGSGVTLEDLPSRWRDAQARAQSQPDLAPIAP